MWTSIRFYRTYQELKQARSLGVLQASRMFLSYLPGIETATSKRKAGEVDGVFIVPTRN